MYPSQRCYICCIKYPIYFKMQLYLSPGYFIDKVWIVNKFQSHVALHQKYWAIFSMQVSITYEVSSRWVLVMQFWWEMIITTSSCHNGHVKDIRLVFLMKHSHFKSREPELTEKIMIGIRYLSASNVQSFVWVPDVKFRCATSEMLSLKFKWIYANNLEKIFLFNWLKQHTYWLQKVVSVT